MKYRAKYWDKLGTDGIELPIRDSVMSAINDVELKIAKAKVVLILRATEVSDGLHPDNVGIFSTHQIIK